MLNTEFISNSHTSIGLLNDYQGTAAGGVNIVYDAANFLNSQQNQYSTHSFINCIFKENIQFSDGSNAGIVSIVAESAGINIFTVTVVVI